MKEQTLAVHAGVDKNVYGTCNTPIYQSVAYKFESSEVARARFALEEAGPIYTRIGNPTEEALETRLASLFGGPALAVASGSAAVLYSVLNLAHAGDVVVVAKNVYGGTFDLFSYTLPNMGIVVKWFDPVLYSKGHQEEFEAMIKELNPVLVFAEAVANPNAEVTDIRGIVESVRKVSDTTKVIIDNTFAPLICDPIKLGADVVVHSATKFISGNGTAMGGCIVESPAADWAGTYITKEDPSYHGAVFTEIAKGAPFTTRARCVILRDTGACISPFNAWLLLNGLETLPLRMKQHCRNAAKVIEECKALGITVNHGALEEPEAYRLNVGSELVPIFTIEVGQDAADAMRFCDRLKLFYQLANVGDSKSLVTHPATTTHSQLSELELKANNIKRTTVRLSIGIEDVDDIIEDLRQAYQSI